MILNTIYNHHYLQLQLRHAHSYPSLILLPGHPAIGSILSLTNLLTPVSSGFFFPSLTFISAQTFSIGFRSGDIEGHGSTLIPLSFFHFLQSFERCFGSLSSWSTHPTERLPKILLIEGRRPFSYTIIIKAAFRFR